MSLIIDKEQLLGVDMSAEKTITADRNKNMSGTSYVPQRLIEFYNNNDAEPTLLEFVKSLLEGQGKILSNGDVSIEITGAPRFLVVHLYDNEDKNLLKSI